MAVINRYPLVLNNVLVARDVVTGTLGNGLVTARMQRQASPSSSRDPSHGFAQTGHETGLRQRDADWCGAASAADRAGRPASCLGVPGQRLASLLASTQSLDRLAGAWAKKTTKAGRVCKKQPGYTPSASTRG